MAKKTSKQINNKKDSNNRRVAKIKTVKFGH